MPRPGLPDGSQHAVNSLSLVTSVPSTSSRYSVIGSRFAKALPAERGEWLSRAAGPELLSRWNAGVPLQNCFRGQIGGHAGDAIPVPGQMGLA